MSYERRHTGASVPLAVKLSLVVAGSLAGAGYADFKSHQAAAASMELPVPACEGVEWPRVSKYESLFPSPIVSIEQAGRSETSRQVAHDIGRSVVKIVIGSTEAGGTGFAMKTPGGETVVVTAGHVIAGKKLEDIHVQVRDDSDIRVLTPTGGCGLYNSDSVSNFATTNKDIAVLTVNDPEQSLKALELGAAVTHVSNAVSVNYQRLSPSLHTRYPITAPATFSTRIVGKDGDAVNSLVSGLDHADENICEDTLVSGASGSPLLVGGKVVGMTVASEIGIPALDNHGLARLYIGATEPQASAYQARHGYAFSPQVVRAILSSPSLDK